MRIGSIWTAVLVLGAFHFSLHAQIDPEKRQLIQLGYNQSLRGQGPVGGYAFYYRNEPGFLRSNLTLRLAVAPVYLDSELGIREALGPNTDLGLGLAGGGFADSFSEIRAGKYIKKESFTGHGGEISSSIYHLINPGQLIPLNAIVRGSLHHATFQSDSATAKSFEVPDDRPSFNVRTGLRWGGREPLMFPKLALEVSAWYEGQFRAQGEEYGYGNDRKIEEASHLFWARALFVYTLPNKKDNFSVAITAGNSVHPDRFSAYRMGAVLPLVSEFPLNLPGYYYQEISAERFLLFGGQYSLALGDAKMWHLTLFATSALVDYLDGFEQAGSTHTGLGAGVTYISISGSWQVVLGYAYGVDAVRHGERGGHSIGLLCQFDLEAKKRADLWENPYSPYKSRGLFRIFR